jgi:membrane protease YdiL (CAAX protease family)
MEPEIQPPLPERQPAVSGPELLFPAAAHTALAPGADYCRDPSWVFLGRQGLRAGWSVLIFFFLSGFPSHAGLFNYIVGTAFYMLHLAANGEELTASAIFSGELSVALALVGAAAVIAFVERRRSLLAFNLDGPRRVPHFISGFAAGFLALSLLVGAMNLGGWLHFGPVSLSGAAILKYAVLWGAAFLLVGCVEEGTFRCYLQFTLARGINFWWALGIITLLCVNLVMRARGNGVWGVYAMALLGLLPCLWLHIRKTPGSGFWQAAWVTSTLFGYIHTSNEGENWIGIFAAALIGFVFCVSVRVTGSAWWAIGCHAAWDWAESYFYGTADSGMVARGHYLSTRPVGNAFWSGGADGPEGSILVIGVILLMLAALLIIYGRKKPDLLAEKQIAG